MNVTQSQIDVTLDLSLEAMIEFATTMLNIEKVERIGMDESGSKTRFGSYIQISSEKINLLMGITGASEPITQLAKTFLMMQAEDELAKEDLVDAIGEVVNIVGGSLKSRLAAEDPAMNLGLPFFVDGEFFTPKDTIDICANVLVGEIPIQIHLVFKQTE